MGTRIILSKISTKPPKGIDEDKANAQTAEWTKRISTLQYALFAEKKQSLLVVLQGMDGSGKDGAVTNVFGRCSHMGVRVQEFRKPTEEEASHDFLWRVHKAAPGKGLIQIFVRSHYEAILIERVHHMISEEKCRNRISAINAFENLLQLDNDTTILKFYLHISHKQQKVKLQQRIDDPNKQWKHNPRDWDESKLWKKYMLCYEEAINQSIVPWHIVPVDKRWYRDYIISKTVCDTLEKMDPHLPSLRN